MMHVMMKLMMVRIKNRVITPRCSMMITIAMLVICVMAPQSWITSEEARRFSPVRSASSSAVEE
eukprot:5892226-Heterocapsa_arctica.AAC.1